METPTIIDDDDDFVLARQGIYRRSLILVPPYSSPFGSFPDPIDSCRSPSPNRQQPTSFEKYRPDGQERDYEDAILRNLLQCKSTISSRATRPPPEPEKAVLRLFMLVISGQRIRASMIDVSHSIMVIFLFLFLRSCYR